MIKNNILLYIMLLVTSVVSAQVETPLSFSYNAKKIDDLTYELHITAVIQKGWHTYSQTTPAGGPLPTVVKFSKNSLVTLVGKAKEVGKQEQHHEKLFGVNVKQYSDKIEFLQIIKLKKPVKTNVAGSIEYMACDDTHCLPPEVVKFSISIPYQHP